MKRFSTVGIIGRGIIGSSWALVFARAGVRVRIWSRHETEIAATRERIGAMIRSLRGTGLEGAPDTLQRISAQASLESTLENPFHGFVEHGDEARNTAAGRYEVALGIGDAGADVEHFIDDRAHRRPAEDGEHFIRRGGKRFLNDG